MSKMDIQDALERVKTATKYSPLLLLTCGEKTNIICCFANTVIARQMAKQSNAIGIFDSTMNLGEIKQRISHKVKEDIGKTPPENLFEELPKHSKRTAAVHRGFKGSCLPFQASP